MTLAVVVFFGLLFTVATAPSSTETIDDFESENGITLKINFLASAVDHFAMKLKFKIF